MKDVHRSTEPSGSGCGGKLGVQEVQVRGLAPQPSSCPSETPDGEASFTRSKKTELPSDVEEDGCPLTHPGSVLLTNIGHQKPVVGLTEELTKLSLGKPQTESDEDSPIKMGVKTEASSERSCDKAAKDLTNLLMSLSVSDKPAPAASVRKDDELDSMVKKIDEELTKLRLCPTSLSSHDLKGRGLGDGDFTWSCLSIPNAAVGELDLQPAADLADYFSRQNGEDMFGNQLQFGQAQTSNTNSYPVYSWNTNTTVLNPPNSSQGPATFTSGFTVPEVSNQRCSGISEDIRGPPTNNYQCSSPGFSNTGLHNTSYSDLLASVDDPSFQYSDLSLDGSVPGPKRTRYEKNLADIHAESTGTGYVTTFDTNPAVPINGSFYSSALSNSLYSSPKPEAGRSPPSKSYYSPSHRLSPTESIAYPSSSSGYGGDFPVSSPGSVLSACPSSALPESPGSLGPHSPSGLSLSSYSSQSSPPDSGVSIGMGSPYSQHLPPQSSPPDSGVSLSMGSPYSQHLPVSPYSPAESDKSTVHVPVTSAPAPPGLQTAAPLRSGPIGQGHPPTASHSQNAFGLSSPRQPAFADTCELLFEYMDEDGDSILHMLILTYENLLVTRGNNSAASFLMYLSHTFLRNQLMKNKLNKQNHMLQTPLYQAVQRHLLPVVKLLVKCGADVNIQGRCEKLVPKQRRLNSPLHVAVVQGDEGLPLVEALLTSHSVNINIQNTEGETPLHTAAKEHGSVYLDRKGQCRQKSCGKVVELLLDQGADIDVKDFKSGKTPIMVAIETKDLALVRMMLDCCDPRDLHDLLNEGTYDMNTCMHVAFGLQGIAKAKHVALVRMLMLKGGEAENENSANLKAREMAQGIFKNAVQILR